MGYEIQEYVTPNGKSYFREWFNKIGANAAAKITSAIYKLENGNFANTKSVGDGVLEFKINAGSGYRIYFAKVSKKLSYCWLVVQKEVKAKIFH